MTTHGMSCRTPHRILPVGVLLCAICLLMSACAGIGVRDGAPELQWLQGARPVFPAAARADRIEGHVVLEYRVAEDGFVEDVRVVESQPKGVFDAAALTAIRSWRYRPYDDGTGVRAVEGVRSRFDFRLGEAYQGL